MSDDGLIEVTVVFGWDELPRIENGAGYADEVHADDVDEPAPLENWSMDLNLEPLGPGRFRVPEPVSVTFAGPHGPMLNFGEVIETVRQCDDVYRYKRTIESPAIWSRVLGGGRSLEALYAGSAAQVLEELEKLGCRWEWCVGNLTVQGLDPTSTGPSREAEALLRQLVDLLRMRGPSGR